MHSRGKIGKKLGLDIPFKGILFIALKVKASIQGFAGEYFLNIFEVLSQQKVKKVVS